MQMKLLKKVGMRSVEEKVQGMHLYKHTPPHDKNNAENKYQVLAREDT